MITIFSSFLRLTFVIYFIVAPIYNQPFIQPEIWYGLKLLFLSLLIFATVIIIFYKQIIFLGYAELLFLINLIISSCYILSDDTTVSAVSLAFLFFYIGKSCSNFLKQEEFINIIIWIARFSAIYITSIFIYHIDGPRINISGNINPNSWALYATICVSSLLYSYFISKRRIDLLLLLIVVGVLIFTGSRGGLLVVVLMFFVFLAFQKAWQILFYGCVSITLFLLLASYSEYFFDTRLHQQIMTLKEGGQLDLTTGRWGGFVTAIHFMENSLLLGIGPVNLMNYGHNHIQIHNYFLRILVENGLVLFIPMIILIIFISYTLFKVNKDMRLLAYFCFILLVTPLLYEPNGLLGNFMISGQLWFIIGYLSVKTNQRPSVIFT